MAATVHLLLLPLIITFFFHHALSDTNSFIYAGCTQIRYNPDSPYQSNLNSLLTSLVNSATYSSFNKYSIMGSTQQDTVYGLYQCRGDLSMPDCATCVARAVALLGSQCSLTCGAALQLDGCFVKYDNATFLGVQDKTLVLKKCAPPSQTSSSGSEAVLNSLAGTGGYYRVGGSGDVQGVAQCVGDLSNGECQDCLTEAIGRLRTECPGGPYGDMYLGKCYARFSTAGAHSYYKPTHDSSHNEGEKTFAIIIGLLAGVALLIIFLTFLRKVFGGNGK